MARKELKRQEMTGQGIVDTEVGENGNVMRHVMGSKFFLIGIQLLILFFGFIGKGVILNFLGS
jgi:hypothetical protein